MKRMTKYVASVIHQATTVASVCGDGCWLVKEHCLTTIPERGIYPPVIFWCGVGRSPNVDEGKRSNLEHTSYENPRLVVALD